MKRKITFLGKLSLLATCVVLISYSNIHALHLFQITEDKPAQEIVYYSVEDNSFRIPELNNKISLNINNKQLADALVIIAEKARLGIAFNPDLFDGEKIITINKRNIRVADALALVLEGTGYESVITSHREILLKEKPPAVIEELEMMQIIEGRVTDAITREPLPGVNVVVEGTTIGTSTDVSGEYELDVPDEAQVLVFTFVGYQEHREQITGRTVINVELQPTVELLEDLVVTSFGIRQERKQLGYAVQEITGEELAETQQSNIVSAMQGRVAGVNIQNSSGAAGAGVDIIIRGINSLSPNADNQPLFVVDGIPISNQTNAGNVLPSEGSNSPGSNEQFSFTNRVADLNPNDIESISILKGSSATALYGLRAANGAVIITTKKGSAGAPEVSFTSSVGFSEITKVPEIQRRFQIGRFGSLPGVGSNTVFWQLGPPVSDTSDPLINNFREFFRTGTNFSNSFSVSGGNEQTTYFTSFSQVREEGVVPNTDWERFTFRLSGSQVVSDNFNISGSISYSNSGGTRP
ncbi:MAG: carboxypeptidase-like regulatory domain-containing protein, partial [Balneolaceae bacterium]